MSAVHAFTSGHKCVSLHAGIIVLGDWVKPEALRYPNLRQSKVMLDDWARIAPGSLVRRVTAENLRFVDGAAYADVTQVPDGEGLPGKASGLLLWLRFDNGAQPVIACMDGTSMHDYAGLPFTPNGGPWALGWCGEGNYIFTL